MLFKRESEMTLPVRRWLSREGLLIKSEFVLPWGICDLVGLSFNKHQVKKRLSYRQRLPIGPLQRVELLRHIPDRESGRSITLEGLQKLADRSILSTSVEDDLNRLIADRFVLPDRHGALQKLNGWAPMHRRIVAVELKLQRISEALSQALSNRAFATESYIALPYIAAERLARGRRQSHLSSDGIGILGVTERTCKVLLRAPQLTEPDETLQLHCVERFWRTRDSSSSAVALRVPAV